MAEPGLLDRLRSGPVICAEGYLFELERRGYLQAGVFVPEVVLEHPEMVAGLHREFVHAGSDVVQAFTYYAHREKLRLIGRETDLEAMNRQALRIANDVAAESGALLAGDVCNTNVFTPGNRAAVTSTQRMFEEQVGWATEAGVDFVIAETLSWGEEALLALEAIKAAGLPAVVTLAIHRDAHTWEGWTPADACRRLEDAGADVVGLNCARGPRTMLPLLEAIRDEVHGPMAALPVPYRTTEEQPTFQSLRDPQATSPDEMPFPTTLDPFTCTATRWAASPPSPTRWGSTTSESVAAPGRTTSAAWPKRSGEPHPRADTAPTCPSTPTSARTPASAASSGITQPSSDAGPSVDAGERGDQRGGDSLRAGQTRTFSQASELTCPNASRTLNNKHPIARNGIR